MIRAYLEAGNPAYAFAQPSYYLREDSTIFRMVEQGLGVSVVPELAFRDLPDTVARTPLREPLGRTIGVAISPFNLKVPAVRAFLDALKADFPESPLPHLGLSAAPAASPQEPLAGVLER